MNEHKNGCFWHVFTAFSPLFTPFEHTFVTNRLSAPLEDSVLSQGISTMVLTKVHESARFQGGGDPSRESRIAERDTEEDAFKATVVSLSCQRANAGLWGLSDAGWNGAHIISSRVSASAVKMTWRGDNQG